MIISQDFGDELKKQYNVAFGRALRISRKASEKTQETLAFDTNLDRSYISLLERGKRSPSLHTIALLSIAMNIAPSHLIRICEEHLDVAVQELLKKHMMQ